MREPKVLVTQREAAAVLEITAPRLRRAVVRGDVKVDFISNVANLFLLATIKRIRRKNLFSPLTRCS